MDLLQTRFLHKAFRVSEQEVNMSRCHHCCKSDEERDCEDIMTRQSNRGTKIWIWVAAAAAGVFRYLYNLG